jgi:hypothetical protein
MYGDMQADPGFCRFWSTHTLAEDADEREVWLFKKPYNCFTTDLNMSGSTDTYDMMLYTNYYTAGDERAGHRRRRPGRRHRHAQLRGRVRRGDDPITPDTSTVSEPGPPWRALCFPIALPSPRERGVYSGRPDGPCSS